MITDNAIVSINNAWDKLVGLLNIRRDDGIRLGDLIADATTGPINLYVETTGSDSNDGSQSKPLKTIQAAIDRIPRIVRHPVNISVGLGSFAGAYIAGFSFPTPAAVSVGNWLSISGTLIPATGLGGLMSGQVASGVKGSGSTFGTVTVTDAGWTVNQLRGKLLRILTGPGANDTLTNPSVIVENTADTITIAGTWSTGEVPTSASTFEIQDWGTLFSSGVVRPATGPTSTPGAQQYCFFISDCESNTTHSTSSGAIKISGFKSTDSTYAFATILAETHIAFDLLSIKPQSSATAILAQSNTALIPVRVNVSRSNVENRGSSGCLILATGGFSRVERCLGYGNSSGQFTFASVASYINVSSSYIYGYTRGLYAVGRNCNMSVSNTRISSCTTGISFEGGSTTVFGTDISNCTTAISGASSNAQQQGVSIYLRSTTGTGNTTAVNALNGNVVFIKSDCTITGTTELSVDGSAFTLAAMRAATPKYCTNATIAITGTKVYGD